MIEEFISLECEERLLAFADGNTHVTKENGEQYTRMENSRLCSDYPVRSDLLLDLF